MRLIVFVRTPENVDPIPFDIIDERSCQEVLEDVLLFTKPSAKDGLSSNYNLVLDGKKIDPRLTLSENGVKNGDYLDLVATSAQPPLSDKATPKTKERVVSPLPQGAKSISKAGNSKQSEERPPIGKKIDFD